MAGSGNKKGLHRRNKPANVRYLQGNHLRRNKVRRIARAQRVPERIAARMWDDAKTGRQGIPRQTYFDRDFV